MRGGELRDGTGEVVDRMPNPEHLGDEDDHEGEGQDDGSVEEGKLGGGLAGGRGQGPGAGGRFDTSLRRVDHNLLPPKGTVIDGRRTIGLRSMKGIRSGTV